MIFVRRADSDSWENFTIGGTLGSYGPFNTNKTPLALGLIVIFVIIWDQTLQGFMFKHTFHSRWLYFNELIKQIKTTRVMPIAMAGLRACIFPIVYFWNICTVLLSWANIIVLMFTLFKAYERNFILLFYVIWCWTSICITFCMLNCSTFK